MSEQRLKLTKKMVDRATPRAAPYWDSALPGFGLRVARTGAKVFFIRYRPKGTGRSGPKRFYTIGKYGPLTPDQARSEAKRVLGEVAAGADPARAIAEARGALTVSDLAELYLDEVRAKRKPTTAALYGDYLHRHVLPNIGRVKAASVGRATIAKLHMNIGKRHPVSANRTLAVISAMFAFAEKRGLAPAGHVNPARGIDKFPETGRERFLTTDELERLAPPSGKPRQPASLGTSTKPSRRPSTSQSTTGRPSSRRSPARRSAFCYSPDAACARSSTFDGPRSISNAAC